MNFLDIMKKGPIRTFQRNRVYHATKHRLSYYFKRVTLCFKKTNKATLTHKSGFIWPFMLTQTVNKTHELQNTTIGGFFGIFLRLWKHLFFKDKVQKELRGIPKALPHFGVFETWVRLAQCVFFALSMSFLDNIFAKESFYQDKQRGYFWFETPSVFDPREKETPPLKDETTWSNSKYKTARDALKAFQEELDEKKAHFVLKPTVDSALSYLKIQKAMLEQSSKVAHVYGKALLMTEKGHATSSYVVNRIKDKERLLESDKKLTLSSRFFDILFVYKKGCPYCEKFKDILVRFQKTFGYHIDALSLDGGRYKDFHPVSSHPVEKLTTFDMVPAVFLVSKTKDIAAPISQGYLPYESLKERIVFILDEIEKGQ